MRPSIGLAVHLLSVLGWIYFLEPEASSPTTADVEMTDLEAYVSFEIGLISRPDQSSWAKPLSLHKYD
jgi:hypothetical protein